MSSALNHPGPLDAELLADRLATEHAARLERRDLLLLGVARFHATHDSITEINAQARAADFVKQIKGEIKLSDTLRESAKRPYLDAGRTVDGFFKGQIIDRLTQAAGGIEAKMTAFARAQAEESRRRAAEAARLAAEEAERKAAEALFAQAQTEDADAAARAAAAEAAAAQKLATANSATHSRVHGDMGSVASLRTRWVFEVTGIEQVPRGYLAINTQAINAAIAMGAREIPGLRIYAEGKVVVR